MGDLLRTDVAGAKGIGMKSVWLKTKENLVPQNIQPDYTITTLSQILTLEVLLENRKG